MKTSVQKWGNSLAVRIPRPFAAEMSLGDDSPVVMTLEEGALVIRPDKDRTWDLEALLADVTDENIHPAWETETAEQEEHDELPEDGG